MANSKYEVKAYTFKAFVTKKDDNPIPFRKMAGFVMRETDKALYIRARGEIFSTKTETCMCCGKPITNEISQYFGLGPICGCHNYKNPFPTKEELHKAVKEYRENHLHKIIWEGWVPKSQIVSVETITPID